MRAFIIVTVQDESHSFTYDVEVPVNVPARKLAGDIVEALNYYHRSSKGEKLLPKSSYAIANRRRRFMRRVSGRGMSRCCCDIYFRGQRARQSCCATALITIGCSGDFVGKAIFTFYDGLYRKETPIC